MLREANKFKGSRRGVYSEISRKRRKVRSLSVPRPGFPTETQSCQLIRIESSEKLLILLTQSNHVDLSRLRPRDRDAQFEPPLWQCHWHLVGPFDQAHAAALVIFMNAQV